MDYSPRGCERVGHDFTTNQIFILNMLYSYLFPFGLSWPVFLFILHRYTLCHLITINFLGGDKVMLENLSEEAKHL